MGERGSKDFLNRMLPAQELTPVSADGLHDNKSFCKENRNRAKRQQTRGRKTLPATLQTGANTQTLKRTGEIEHQ